MLRFFLKKGINIKVIGIIILIINPFFNYAQNNYYTKDSSTMVGAGVQSGTDRDNAQFCQVKEGEKIVKYTPSQVSAYGFKDGREYFSREITENGQTIRVFLERLVNDTSMSLYYYRGDGYQLFFIETKAKILVPVRKDENVNNRGNYQQLLAELTNGCPNVGEVIPLVKYNKKAMIDLVNRYLECERKPYPIFHYGITVGLDACKYKLQNTDELDVGDLFDYQFKTSFSIGVFIDQPLFLSSFSLYVGGNYSYHSYSYNKLSGNIDYDLLMEVSTLNVPLMLRYTKLNGKIHPYANIGVDYAMNFKMEKKAFQSEINGNTVIIGNVYNENSVNEHFVGCAMGAGADYQLTKSIAVFCEFRYNLLLGIPTESGNQTQIQFLTGIKF